MYIEKLLLKNFGKFNNFEIDLDTGLNVIYGKNESGKSTLFSFIKGILFGIEKQRGRAAKTDAYVKLEPWDNPTFFEGRCLLVKGGVHYILERRFYKGDKSFYIINRDTGERLSEEAAEAFFEGLSESRYLNSISVGQARQEDDTELIKEIQNCIANLDVSHGAEIDVEAACKSLKDKKREFIKKQDEDVLDNIKKFEDRLLYAKYEERKLVESLGEADRHIKELEERQEILKNRQKNRLGIKGIVVGALMLVLFTVLIFIDNRYAWIVALLASCVAGVSAFVLLDTWRYYNRSFEKLAEEIKDAGGEFAKKELLLEQCREKGTGLELELEKLQEKLEYNEELQLETKALQLACDTIEMLSARLKEEFSGRLNKRISELVAVFTCGEYNEIRLDKDGNIFVIKDNKLIPIEQLSKGTIEQIRLAVRLVVADDVFGLETIPVILDESFVYFDDSRLRQILKSLASLDRQILIFTCHEREIKILNDEGISFKATYL